MNRIAQIEQFLAQSPDDLFLNHALALEYIKQDDDVNARLRFEKNLAHDEKYVATYYHLGKLLERNGDTGKAVAIYEKGMVMARETGDMHAYNELQGAYDDLVY